MKRFFNVFLILLIASMINLVGCINSNQQADCVNTESFDYQIIMLDGQTGGQMMSFLVYTKQGELFVVDGGYKADADYLVENIRKYGGVVSGWFLSHYHSDHVGAIKEILNRQDLINRIEIKCLYYNFPEIDMVKEYEFDSEYEWFCEMNTVFESSRIKKVIVSNNQLIEYESLKIRILRTYNPLLITNNFGNNSTSVYMFYFGDYKMCFLGDLGEEGGNELLSVYPTEDLKCQIVQMAHHGQSGVSKEVYLTMNPKICFWPTPLWLWENDNGEGFDSGHWKTLEVRKWIKEIGAISFVSKNGIQTLNLYK